MFLGATPGKMKRIMPCRLELGRTLYFLSGFLERYFNYGFAYIFFMATRILYERAVGDNQV